ncbi:MAG: DUF2147 domain-containing protein [Taibaiella sp.]|nr:DUF2147 domain-containing protein [Taibaiella sp.]
MKAILITCTFLLLTLTGRSQAKDPIEHNWYNEEQTAKIQIYKEKDGKFYGKIVWLKVPNIDSKPKIDNHNPEPAHRNDPILGLLLLKHFQKHGENKYDNGTVYDPRNGKTYSCDVTRKNNTIEVRGYVGISMFGKTTTWTIAD